eukprot:GFYU01004702.1.p1 GENE.GFYU01004702.1~~GFYU01004702.1.p1  ORF type:complete len:593 (+),score=181.62 GFYU01004702.1:60-1838(+)
MAGNRKLIAEIERTLKKVTEGIEVFDSIWDKVYSAQNANQKEKYEADLKKEIKKLQRYRDTIKTWVQNNDIKDKKPLLDARKNIETQMERFKVCEKETKTKAFSKEGLGQNARVDPAQKKRDDVKNWVNEFIDQLTVQVDLCETQIESARSQKKNKKNQAHIDELDQRVDKFKYHNRMLEKVLRMVDNESIAPEQVDELKEDLDYFLADHAEPDYQEYDIYETLGITEDDVDDETGSTTSALTDDVVTKKKEVAPDPVLTRTTSGSFKETIQIQPIFNKSQKEEKKEDAHPKKEDKKEDTHTKKDVKPTVPKPTPAQPGMTAAAVVAGNTPGPVNYAQAAQATLGYAQQVKKGTMQQPATPAGVGRGKPTAPPPASQAPPPQPQPPQPHTQAQPTQPPATQGTSPTPPAQFSDAKKEEAQSPEKFDGPTESDAMGILEGGDDLPPFTPQDMGSLNSMLDASLRNMPEQPDPSSVYVPRNPFPQIPGYPIAPNPNFENPALFEKFDTDTLFFIFYYQQGTLQQYLAARELKKQSWRYHKKYLTWFQRHEEPKKTTDEYEQGTYVYFDYETGWCQRIKTEFTFEYQYLEDELMV